MRDLGIPFVQDAVIEAIRRLDPEAGRNGLGRLTREETLYLGAILHYLRTNEDKILLPAFHKLIRDQKKELTT
jgi:hypothetical protein